MFLYLYLFIDLNLDMFCYLSYELLNPIARAKGISSVSILVYKVLERPYICYEAFVGCLSFLLIFVSSLGNLYFGDNALYGF